MQSLGTDGATAGFPARSRYLVQSPHPGTLSRFLDAAATDADLQVVDRIGPADEPHTAVIVMSSQKADALRQQFRASGQSLTIEPDQPLSLS